MLSGELLLIEPRGMGSIVSVIAGPSPGTHGATEQLHQLVHYRAEVTVSGADHHSSKGLNPGPGDTSGRELTDQVIPDGVHRPVVVDMAALGRRFLRVRPAWPPAE